MKKVGVGLKNRRVKEYKGLLLALKPFYFSRIGVFSSPTLRLFNSLLTLLFTSDKKYGQTIPLMN